MNPVPHVTPRQLASREAAEDFLGRLRDDARVTRALLVAGDGEPVGPYESSAQFLETGLLEAHGIRSVGIAGYPEAHPRIPEAALAAALDRKIEDAARRGIELFVVTQFCFEGEAVLDWLARLRARGVTLPVRVGVAGPASIRALLNFGKRCGIGNSLRAVRSHALSLPHLLVEHGPDKVVRRIGEGGATLGVAGLHCFSFGGFARQRPVARRRSGRPIPDRRGSGRISRRSIDPRHGRVPSARYADHLRRPPCHNAPPRRSAPITSAASCAPRSCSTRASASARARSRARAARGRGPRDPRRRPLPGGPRPAGHHRRRVSAHLLPHRLPGATRRRRDAGGIPVKFHSAAGDVDFAPPVLQGDREGAPREADPARRLRVPQVGRPPACRR